MKLYITIGFLSMCVLGISQKISNSFHAVIKNTPDDLNIIQHTDGNLLVYGDINYYGDAQSGSLIKVDQSGNLIGTFQKVFTDESIESLAVLPSGKILIQGRFKYVNGVRVGKLALINADGTFDPNFHVAHNTLIDGFAVQSTGKIIIHGYSDGQDILARLQADGSPDATFSPGITLGKIVHLATAPDDNIYVASNTKLYRLASEGAVDNTFNMVADPNMSMITFAQQADGKLVVSVLKVVVSPVLSFDYILIRLNSNGALDNTFATGKADAQIFDVSIRSNGKIILTGYFSSFASQTGHAFELNADGSVSKSLLTTDYNAMYCIYEDAQNNLFITGGFKTVNMSVSKPGIVKLRPDYSIDQGFNVPVSRTEGPSTFLPLAYQDGNILVGGDFLHIGVGTSTKKLNRILVDGSLDPVFSPAISTLSSASVSNLLVQPDKKILVAGNRLFPTFPYNFGRLLANGSMDNSFQTGTGLTVSPSIFGTVRALRWAGDKIYVAGEFNDYNGTACRSFVILNSDGSLWGPAQMGVPVNSYVMDMEIQSSGKIVLMGDFPIPAGGSQKFIRLNADGSLDNSFSLSITGSLFDFDIDADDKILVTGNYLDGDASQIVKRFNSDGSVDNTLDQGSGFDAAFSGYTVKSMAGGRIAIGGIFYKYQGITSPGLTLMNSNGEVIPFENSFDSLSRPIAFAYGNNTLYMAGRFSKNHGQEFLSTAKMVFPIQSPIENLSVQAIDNSQIGLSWIKPLAGVEDVRIERSELTATNFEEIQTISPLTVQFEDTELTETTKYFYRITAINDGYESMPSEGFATTLIAPAVALLATNITDRGFTANWEYLAGTDSCTLQISTDNFLTFTAGFENRVVKSGSLNVDGLPDGVSYQYRVKRHRNGKTSSFSNPIIVDVITAASEYGLNLLVYPNPFSDALSVRLSENTNEVMLCQLRSLNGKLAIEYKGTTPQAEFPNLDRLPPGLYILSISVNSQTKRLKVIKQ